MTALSGAHLTDAVGVQAFSMGVEPQHVWEWLSSDIAINQSAGSLSGDNLVHFGEHRRDKSAIWHRGVFHVVLLCPPKGGGGAAGGGVDEENHHQRASASPIHFRWMCRVTWRTEGS